MAAAQRPIKGLTIGVPTAFYVDDLDPEVARILDETVAVLKREGADDRSGRTAGPAPAHRGLLNWCSPSKRRRFTSAG